MAGTVELPEGFVVDEPTTETESGLPEGFTLDAPEESEPVSTYDRLRPFIQTSMEGTFTAGAGFVGGVAGATAGSIIPFAGTAAGAALGAGSGGTLGFAASQEIMSLLDNAFGVSAPKEITEEFKELGAELKSGAEISFGGELGIPLLKALVVKPVKKVISKFPPLSKSKMQEKAGEVLADIGTEGTQEQISKNIKIAKGLESRIKGLKFTRGQITNDAQAITLERSLTRKGGADLNQEQRAYANDTLQKYYRKKVSKAGNVSDFTESLIAQKEGLESTLISSQQKVDSEVLRLNRVMDEQEIGTGIVGKLSKAKNIAKNKATEIYNRISNAPLNPVTLNETVGKLIDNFDNTIEKPKNFPSRLINGILEKINPSGKALRNIGFQDLRQIRATVNEEIREASTGLQPNRTLTKRLETLKDGIDDTLNQLEGEAGKDAQLLKKANSFFREFVGKFRQGKVADVLQRGTRGEETKIASANIAREFFTKDGADDFLRAVGNDELAVDMMRDYSRYDLLNKALDPSTGKLVTKRVMQWVNKNGKVLEKLGIKGEFQDIATLQRAVDANKKNIDTFNKSVASRFMNADIDGAVNAAFRGSNNIGSTATELLSLTKGNEAAEMGLKKAFADNILRQAQNTGVDLFENPIIGTSNLKAIIARFSPAIKVLYKNEPEKIKAMLDVHKAYKILNRNLKSPTGGGSDTMENIANSFVSIAAPAATSRFAWVNAIKALTRTFSEYSEEQVNRYLLKATFDPDYAKTLIDLTKANIKSPITKALNVKGEVVDITTRFNELMILPSLGMKNLTESIQGIRGQSTLGGNQNGLR